MNKAEAIEAMKAGKKITHEYFSGDEWMTMENGKILTEEGYRHSANEFWFFRTAEGWQQGYSLYTK